MKHPPSPAPSQSQSPHQDPSQADLSQCQLDKALALIDKLKQIKKSGKLTQLKQNSKSVNKLFNEMSEFFVNKKKAASQAYKLDKKQRVHKRRQRLLEKYKTVEDKIFKDSISNILEKHDEQSPQQSELPHQMPHIQQDPDYEPPKQSRHCYICSQSYKDIDNLYYKHCPKCAQFSKVKRTQTADLHGLVAVVTGARIKIGYEITLKLLRDGAKVYATTRFTHDAFLRYEKEPDYLQWKDRLVLVQCDFLSCQQVTRLIGFLKQNVRHLDILIHNAAQTLVRPVEFYTFQLQNQQKMLGYEQGRVIKFEDQAYPSLEYGQQGPGQAKQLLNDQNLVDLSQRDQFGQPLDLRAKNTWKEKIDEVSLNDCLSTQIINSTIPFYMTGQLKPLMGGSCPSFVMNVSSMEGVFYRPNKTPNHPHTNMAKASLNMITRTISEDFKKCNIYVNSVDTGWVTNENPLPTAIKVSYKHDFEPPLDCLEGAMRVLDPVYLGVRDRHFIHGQFLKNYQPSFW